MTIIPSVRCGLDLLTGMPNLQLLGPTSLPAVPQCDGIESASGQGQGFVGAADVRLAGCVDGWAASQTDVEQPSLYEQSVGQEAINGHW